MILFMPCRRSKNCPTANSRPCRSRKNCGSLGQQPDADRQAEPEGEAKEQKLFTTIRVEDPDLVKDLNQHGVKFTGVIETTFWRDLLSWILPALIFVGIWFFIFRRLGQAQGGFMQVGQSKAKIYMEKDIKVTFADVAGVDEAKEELQEVIEFLKTPDKFTKLGGKIPKGILLVGPPAPEKRCWLAPWRAKPVCRFSASAGRSSWRCSSGSGPRECVISSSRRSSRRPASSSSTSWMPGESARGGSDGP